MSTEQNVHFLSNNNPYVTGGVVAHKPVVFISAPTEKSPDMVVETYVRLSALPNEMRENIHDILSIKDKK